MIDHPDVKVHLGDALEQLAAMRAESVHCIVTSPPFWGLRDYGEERQIGLEATPEEWCARLVGVMREARRVLRHDGTLWLEVGDTYSTRWSSRQGDSRRGMGVEEREARNGPAPAGFKTKELIGAPWMLAFALRADGWFLRSDIIWHRPNPMPESVLDRPTKSHSYVFLLAKRQRYFYDADAIREPLAAESIARYGRASRYDDTAEIDAVPYRATRPRGSKRRTVREGVDTRGGGQGDGEMGWDLALGANARTLWSIPTQPTPFEHYATFPEELARRCIAAGTSEKGCCPECGAPWGRVAPSCECGTDDEHDGYNPVPCTVLDPFMGSGTTALVARKMGRHAVGIELSPEYLEIARDRLAQQSLFA